MTEAGEGSGGQDGLVLAPSEADGHPTRDAILSALDLAVELTGARQVSVVTLDTEGRASQLVTRGAAGGGPGDIDGAIAAVLQGDRPVRQARFLGVPIVVRGRVLGAMYVTGHTGAPPFGDRDQERVTVLAGHVGMALDNASLLEDRVRRGQAVDDMKDVSQALLDGRDPDDVLRLVARRTMGLLGAALACVASPEPDRASMAVRVAEGEAGPGILGMTFPAGDSWSGRAMRAGTAQLADQTADDPITRAAGMGSAVFIPLGTADEAFGVLALFKRPDAGVFDEHDLGLVDAFAAETAVVLRYAQVRSDLARLSRLEDHERIAMELHDGVVQTLFAVGLSIEAIAGSEVLADGRDKVRARLTESVTTVHAIISDLRMYIEGLHPPHRPGQGRQRTLVHNLVDLVQSFRGSTTARIIAEVDPRAASLLEQDGAEIVQAAREALSNAVRHSGAAAIALRLRTRPDDVVLDVNDDGVGFDPDLVKRGRGLSNLRSRAGSLGGVLRIETEPGRGTTVQIVIPA